MMSCASGNSRRLSIKFMCVTLPYMSISRRIVVAVAFHEVDNTPHRKTRTESDNERLKNRDSLIDESHRFSSLI